MAFLQADCTKALTEPPGSTRQIPTTRSPLPTSSLAGPKGIPGTCVVITRSLPCPPFGFEWDGGLQGACPWILEGSHTSSLRTEGLKHHVRYGLCDLILCPGPLGTWCRVPRVRCLAVRVYDFSRPTSGLRCMASGDFLDVINFPGVLALMEWSKQLTETSRSPGISSKWKSSGSL